MRILVDAMGGDHAPIEVVAGTVMAASRTDAQLILVGEESAIRSELSRAGRPARPIEVRHASQSVGMHEQPVLALRQKKDASILVAMRLVKQKQADAVISAGSTGAAMAAAKVVLKSLEGVDRPAIPVIYPTTSGVCVLLDVGANVDCKPLHLLQFAVMGKIYAQLVLGVKEPRVGLLNVGEEEGKGNELTKAAHKLIGNGNATVDFVGNVEGRDLFNGKADVVVCDGFVGNVVLKANESLALAFASMLKGELKADLLSRFGAVLSKAAFNRFRKKIDYAEHGGAPLLGINGVVIICHGGSNAKAICNAILEAEKAIKRELNTEIVKALAEKTDLVGTL